MAYRTFENFDPTSVKQVNPLEGIGEAVARGMALGQQDKAQKAAAALQKQKLNDADYKELADVNPKDFWDRDAEVIAGEVKNYANQHTKGKLSGQNPYSTGLPQKKAEIGFMAGKSQQDKAEYNAIVTEIDAQKPYINKEVLKGGINAEAAKGLGSRDFKKWQETEGNLLENPAALNVPVFYAEYNKTVKPSKTTIKNVDEKGFTTTTTLEEVDAPPGVEVIRKKNGEVTYDIPPANQKMVVDNIIKFEPLVWQRNLKQADKLYDEAATKYTAANGGNATEIATKMKAGQMNEEAQQYLPKGISGTPGQIAQAITIKEYKENLSYQARYENQSTFDQSSYLAATKAKSENDTKVPTVSYNLNRTFMSSPTGSGTVTERFTPVEVGMSDKGKDIELQAASVGTVYDYKSKKRVNAETAGISNKNLVLSTAKLVVRNTGSDGYIGANSEKEMLAYIAKHPNPEKLKLDFWIDATAKNESDGSREPLKKEAAKTYGVFADDIAPQLNARKINLLNSLQADQPDVVNKYQQAIQSAIEKKKAGGKANTASSSILNKGGKKAY